MKKRILSTILAVLMLLGAVMMTACSNGTPANDEKEPEVTDNTGDKASESKDAEAVKAVGNFEVPEGGYDGSEVTIKFYNTMGTKYTDMMTHYIEEFNKLYPNIHVECTSVGSYDDVRDQISTEITVGN